MMYQSSSRTVPTAVTAKNPELPRPTLGVTVESPAAAELKKRLVDERTAALAALQESEERFRRAFDDAAIGMALVSPDGRWMQVNRSICGILGYTADELLATDFQSITHPDDLHADLDFVRQLLAGEIPYYQMTKRYLHRQGHLVWALLSVSLVRDGTGKPLYFISQIQDMSERHRAERLENDRRRVMEMLVEGRPLDAILGELAQAIQRQIEGSLATVLLVRDGRISTLESSMPANWKAAIDRSALPLSVALSRGAWESPDACGVTLFDSDPIWRDFKALAAGDGLRACWATPLQSDEGPLGILTVFCRSGYRPSPAETGMLDMASKLATICIEHHNAHHRLTHLVSHDSLTGLANRLLFEDRLDQALALSRRNEKLTGLLMIDLDKFKSINDTLGHASGDHLIQQFALRLCAWTRPGDTVARLGGDEFAIILPGLAEVAEAETIARQILNALATAFDLPNATLLHVTASIGIAASTVAQDATSLKDAADQALYRVKANGRNGYHVH